MLMKTLFLILSLSRDINAESTINIDININKKDELPVTRNTTSTVYKTEDTDFENLLDSNKTACEDKPVAVGEELVFGEKLDNVIRLEGNLSWTDSNIINMECVTEFVLMVRDGDNASSAATVLCPGYKIMSSGRTFWCQYSLGRDTCGQRLHLMLESWSDNRMIQPSTVVTVNCQQDEEEEEEVASWQLPLVLASLNTFSDVIRNQANKTKEEEREKLGCTWSKWTAWSSCSITCGGRGRRVRSRSQAGSRVCTEVEEEQEDCQTNLCPVNCLLSVWGDWSPCSRSCGVGVRSRQRTVTREAQNWGASCPSNLSEEETCRAADCQVNGGWTTWSRWGYCSQTCGTGERSRSRTCTSPPPQNGGEQCAGASLETKECTRRTCPPVDGKWSAWTRWTPCSKTCGRGEQRRTRTCTKPPASHGGLECGGERFQTNNCLLRRCPGDTYRAKEDKETAVVVIDDQPPAVPQNGSCGDPPHVLGFLDPEVVSNSTGSDVVFYTCSRGQVLDTVTNTRGFSMVCGEAGQWEEPADWPECRAATHCVGPVRAVEAGDGLHPPLPRRDAPVNSEVRYKCVQDPARQVSAGCFYDGHYRYDPAHPDCVQSHEELDLCSQSGPADNSNVIIAVPHLNSTSYGWLTSPGYPDYTNKSGSCSWNIKAPHGYILAIGMEDIGFDPANSNKTQQALELTEAGQRSKKTFITQKDRGRTFLSQDNSILVTSLPAIKQFWRLSYLVVTPT